MKKIKFKKHRDDDSQYDADTIVQAMKRMGYQISVLDAHRAWKAYSRSMAAGWMDFPFTDDEIYAAIWPHIQEEGFES